MKWQFSPYLLLLLVVFGISLLVAVMAWHNRDRPGGRPLTALVLATAWWSLSYAVGRSARYPHPLPTCSTRSQTHRRALKSHPPIPKASRTTRFGYCH
ncbi:hypothetical protein E6P09_17335 (plasmid) [Haloferax mediterranei ATCC 33500]|uniref:Histidine kinase N-terminal 7TM region domain-containing protein n=1 Tax=Haloferax mediterranei (strain ATCC 33500 / DSM 1411 / JCM 8866 / NBRC 14739 / NCIMB 2177 / R-4) TaxID=523841 RepID=A0A4P8P840_HALMT|nr:hypothetical protein E6P09_17335 [Haloferax mediterranei ATCC 33500]